MKKNIFLEKMSQYRNLTCSAAWRSIGSNIFIEFGNLKYKINRSGIHIPYGEISIGIHADYWIVSHSGVSILSSETVNNKNLEKVFKKYLIKRYLPVVNFEKPHSFSLIFYKGFALHSEGGALDIDDKLEPELSVRFPDQEIVHFRNSAGGDCLG
jgi:hypothetical protein